MAEEKKKNILIPPPCFGRQKYYTSLSAENINEQNVADVVRGYFNKFTKEIGSMGFLERFFRGDQPILGKERDDEYAENSKIVVNIARTATNKIKHAFIGEETQYLPIRLDDDLQGKALKDLLLYYREIEESAHNSRIESDRGKFGYAYEYVGRHNGKIKIKRLKPFNTCAVYNENDEDEMVFVFNFYSRYDDKGEKNGYRFNVYTKQSIFQYETNELCGLERDIVSMPNELGVIPIVCYENNDELMGDFEPAVSILNAINEVYSKRIDNINDIVEALLVFINSTIYEEKVDENGNVSYDDTKIKAMKKNRIIEMKGEPGLPADIKHIVNTLDQSNTQIVCDNLARLAYVVIGVPDDVNAKTSGGGDTGEAANTREGYKSFEQLLNDKERFFKKGLKQRIEIIRRLSLFINDNQIRFIKPCDVDIRFIRQRTLNSQSDAQMIATLKGTGLFSPDTVITQSNICETPQAEIDKVMANLKKLKTDKILTEEQYNKAVASYYIPTDIISNIFVSNGKGDANGTKEER